MFGQKDRAEAYLQPLLELVVEVDHLAGAPGAAPALRVEPRLPRSCHHICCRTSTAVSGWSDIFAWAVICDVMFLPNIKDSV